MRCRKIANKKINRTDLFCYKLIFIFLINELKSTTEFKFGLINIMQYAVALCVRTTSGLRFNALLYM